jgi:predicted AAA+ superfamily ATPase
MEKPRYLSESIRQDALEHGKMAFVSGPRQVGKTTLAKQLLETTENYHSWDDADFRRAWSRSPRSALSDRGPGPMVLDEIHKDRRWKTRLKGVYDTEGAANGIIVTGSARLDIYRRGGDSLLGRFIPYRLHPFSVAETDRPPGPDEIFATTTAHRPLADLLRTSGFPEPFLGGSELRARRWSRLRIERLLTEDVRDLRAVDDLSAMRVLADLLPERVGSLLSMNSLREDVGVAYATVRSWLQVFDALYHSFLVHPYARRVVRAIRSTPKLYLFDILQIRATEMATRLENLTALHLLKACQYWTDLAHGDFELRFIRDKQQREVDFLVIRDGEPWLLVECKSGETAPSPALLYFQSILRVGRAFQLVTRPAYDRLYAKTGVRVLHYERFFAGLV